MGEYDGQLALPLERPRSDKALEEDAAERVQVGPSVDLVSVNLFRRDIVDRADEAAIAGEARDGGDVTSQTEVADERALLSVTLGNEDVAGLDVAVDEPELVRRVESVRDLCHQPKGAGRLEGRFAPENLPKIGPLDVLHSEIEMAPRLTGGDCRDDIRVLEACRKHALALEPLAEARIVARPGSDDLHGDGVARLDRLGEVHLPHRARAQRLTDSKPADNRALGDHRHKGSFRPHAPPIKA